MKQRKQKKKVEWTRLDNASKIFPAVCNDKDTKVFRIACELHEPVVPGILQQALNLAVEGFPLFRSVLRRGIFWYYFESSELKPVVEIESEPVCAPIYSKEKRNLLFRVFYFNNRISLEIFHALSDGTGALWFMKTLVYHYLLIRNKKTMKEMPKLNYDVSISKGMDDSFGRYFCGRDNGGNKENKNGRKYDHVYHIRGTRNEENRMKLIEGCMSAGAVLDEAHKYNTTLTVYIASLLIYSIYREMPAYGRDRPIVLSVPINLRQFFESKTARNFFSTMEAGFCPDKNDAGFADIIQSVSADFKSELTAERMSKKLNRFMSLEKNLLARMTPLPLKNYSLRLANKIMDRDITASISNVGRIFMPPELEPFIRQFSIFTSARRLQICMCSYGDKLVISFTSPFTETEIQRTFFEFLSEKGVQIEISSNY